MTRVSQSGAATPDVAWERYVRPALWSTWSPPIRAVDCSDAVIRAGSFGVVHGPVGVRVRFVANSVDDESRTWAWTVRSGSLTLRLRHGVEPSPGGALTWLEVEGPGVVAASYAQFARVALRRLVSR